MELTTTVCPIFCLLCCTVGLHGRIRGGGGPGGPPPPFLGGGGGHDIGFLTLGPKLDPLLPPPPFFLLLVLPCRPKTDPPLFKNPGSAPDVHWRIQDFTKGGGAQEKNS